MSGESKNKKNSESSKEFVLPGDLLETKSKPGKGIFRKDGRVYSSVVGYSNDRSGYVNVNAIKGRYNPKVGDKVIGVIVSDPRSLPAPSLSVVIEDPAHPPPYGIAVTKKGRTVRFSLNNHSI